MAFARPIRHNDIVHARVVPCTCIDNLQTRLMYIELKSSPIRSCIPDLR